MPSANNNYKEIYKECYEELSAEDQKEVDEAVQHVMNRIQRHKFHYEVRRGLDKNYKVGFGPESAKELLIALMMKGFIK